MLNHALSYADLGYSIFPLKPGEKVPLLPGGFKNATTDNEKIIEWWTKYPDANIGLSAEGLVIIDIDDQETNQWYLELPDERAVDLCTAPHQSTPRGGLHFFFRRPPNVDIRCSAGKIAKNVDIRTNGGYVVIAPSVGPQGAKFERYGWLSELPGGPDEIEEAPGWLVELVAEKRVRKLATNGIEIGKRNAHLTSVAGSLRRIGIGKEAILAALIEENKKCTPPLGVEELGIIASSISRYEPEKNVGETVDVSIGNALSWPQISRMDIQPPQWLLKDLVLEKGLHIFGGPPGSYKSFINMTAAMHIATGMSFTCRHVSNNNPTKVLYIGAEGGFQLLRRFQLLEKGMELKPSENLTVIPNSIFLDSPEIRDGLRGYVEAIGAKVLILDPLREVARLREDKHDGWQEVVSWMRELANEICVIVIHHTRKLQAGQKKDCTLDSLSGPGYLPSSCDLAFLVFRNSEDDEPGFRISNVKARDVEMISYADFAVVKKNGGVDIQMDSKLKRERKESQ